MKNNKIKFIESEDLPINFHFLSTEKKTTDKILNFAFCKKYNGKLIVGAYYKENSNILLLDE